MTNRALSSIKKYAMATAFALAACSTSQAEVTVPISEAPVVGHQMRAAQFLLHTTMGPKLEEVEALGARMQEIGIENACREWLETQMAMPPGGQTYADTHQRFANKYRLEGNDTTRGNYWNFTWWTKAIQDEDQLRQRVAWGLSQIFVASRTFFNGKNRFGVEKAPAIFYDVLRDNAFGNHLDLLEGVTYNPLMGVFLGSAHNPKANEAAGTTPDENYAREIMQLFSIGVFKRHMNGSVVVDADGALVENYTADDVFELAQAFTGICVRNVNTGEFAHISASRFEGGLYMVSPMGIVPEHRDQSPKEFLGEVINIEDDEQEVRACLKVLADHPNTAPHMSLRLLQRLTSSNPSPGYVKRVATVWKNTSGDFSKILKAIYLDPEFMNSIKNCVAGQRLTVDGAPHFRVWTRPIDTIGGHLREPILKKVHYYRFSGAKATGDTPAGYLALAHAGRCAGMVPVQAPSVFNYYDWEYSPTSGPMGELSEELNAFLVSPEMEIYPTHYTGYYNSIFKLTKNGSINRATPVTNNRMDRLARAVNLPSMKWLKNNKTPKEFLDILDIHMCGGKIPQAQKDVILEKVSTMNNQHAIIMALVYNSSEYSVAY